VHYTRLVSITDPPRARLIQLLYKSEGESGDEARLVRLAWVGHRVCYG